jgi:hypothetical protein
MHVTPPPVLPGPGAVSSPLKKPISGPKPAPPSPPASSGGTVDLLGLDFGSAPAQPTANNSTAQPQNAIFDDFLSAQPAQVSAPSPVTPQQTPAVDLFGGDLFAENTTKHSMPQNAAPMQPASNAMDDLFGALPSTNNSTNNLQTFDAFGSSNGSSVPAVQAHSTNASNSVNSSTNDMTTINNRSTIWDDLNGKINMDLYDLNLKNTNAKPAPSLSQMQQQQTKSTGNSLW